MPVNSVVSIALNALKYAVVPIKRQFGYVISSKSYVQDLQKEVGKLAYETEMVRNEVEMARNNNRNVYSPVTQWQANAEEALKEARDLLYDFEKATKTCCYGSLPEPSCRYQFSRKAKAKIQGVQRLAQEYSQFKDISFSDPAPGHVAASTPAGREVKDVVRSPTATAFTSSASTSIKLKDDDVFESRELIMQEIMAALEDNSNGVVGVYGMGGVGKSTLLVDAEKTIRKEKSFDWIAKADVSGIPDIKRIQGEIADALGLRDIKDKETVSGRAKLLRERLEKEEKEKKKVLIILDNLWERLDLKSVGIPCGHDNKVIGCKLLLTSRDQNVLRREMGCDRDFRLGGLQEEEAKRLFQRTVGKKVHDDPFKSLVDEALNKCEGLPFLIIAMANIFKDADFREWKDVLRQVEMSTSKNISGTINEMLRLTYDRFKGEEGEEVKSLLRLCVVYGVSKPSLENLVRYGMGLKLFREDSNMEEVRDRLSSLIRTLNASSLLLVDDGDVDGFKIHDLVRGFVTSVTSRDDPLLVLKDNDKFEIELWKNKLKSCTAVCFPYVDMEELPKELDCPEMQIFLLFTNNESLKVPNSYFNSMRKLMVLHISQVHLTRSVSPFQSLEKLHTLCLDHCSLEDVAVIGKLKGLQILSFVNSKIERLSKEIEQLVELRLLDLNHCSTLEKIDPGVLGSLINLEELYMENSFDRWNAVGQTPPTNAELIELNNMKNLCTLYASIPDLSMLPEDLNVKKLTKYKIQIGDVHRLSSCKGPGILDLKLDSVSDTLQKGCIQTLLGKTDVLFFDGLNGIEQSICVLSQEGFPNLKHLYIENSPSIHYVIQSPSQIDFKTLESLLLKDLINLEKICNNDISSMTFSALKVVRVESCNKLEVLFPHSLLRKLPQLEVIQAVGCPLMREIVDVDDCSKVDLHNLRVLELSDLPKIKNFFTAETTSSTSTSDDQIGTQVAFFNKQRVSIPSLEYLRMAGLPNMEDIWAKESPLGLNNLQFLEVSSCKSLSKVIYFRTLVKLHKLQTLIVEDCILVQEIFCLDELGANANTNTLLELNTIYIAVLPSLRRIWSKNPCRILNFHNLKKLEVISCNNLEFLFFPSMVQYLTQLRELKVRDCKKMEAIIMEEEGSRRETLETLIFSMLTKLSIGNLESLKCFSHKKCSQVARSKDRVKSCSTTLFNEEGAFPKLQELKLDLFGQMEIWHGHHNGEFFCKLRVLELYHLSKESAMSTCHFVQSLTNLEELVVCESSLEKLSAIMEAIEGPSQEEKVMLPLSRFLQHLKTLDVSCCDELSNMFTPTIAENLTVLTKLRIYSCKTLTEVICDGGGEEGHVVAFNQLKYMELDGLTELRCFSSFKYTLKFPLLEDFIVSGCPNMKFFSEGPIEASKLERVQVSAEIGFWKENLNITIQSMFEEMATMSNIKNIRLSKFPELIGKWHGEFNPIKSFWQSESLMVDRCPYFTSAIPSRLMLLLNNTRRLQVRDCESLEEIFDTEGLVGVRGTQVLPSIMTLDLVNLPKLRRLWNKNLQGLLPYKFLWVITLYNCSNLRHSFTPSMARCLANLWRIEIEECGQMEGVIAEEEGQGSVVENIIFPNLYTIKLECLPNLASFLSGKNQTLDCPDLRELTIAHSPQMSSLTGQTFMEIEHRTPSLFTPQVQFPRLESIILSHMDNLTKIWTEGPQDTLTFEHLQKVKVKNCTSLQNLFPHWVATILTKLEKLRVESCGIKEIVVSGDDSTHPITAELLFPQLTSLVFHDMPRLESFISNLCTLNWPFLKKLRVTHCGKLDMLSPATSLNKRAERDNQQDLLGHEAHFWFERGIHTLERLSLVDKDIQMIHNGKYSDDIFGKLKALTLACFHDENAVFPSKILLERFQNLQSLEVFCSSFEDIFPDEGLFDEGKHTVFENLKELKLSKLHNLKHVWREDYLISKILQSVKSLKVWDCYSLTRLFPTVTSFQNLTELVVKNSSGLEHLVTISEITNLVHITDLTIIGCKRMKEIVANDENKQGILISFGKLEWLTLLNLPSLECFSSTSCTFRFPSLYYIEVEDCPKMKIFSKGTLRTPTLSYVRLFRYNWEGNWEGDDLNTTIQKLSA